jgi:hypothetical protein
VLTRHAAPTLSAFRRYLGLHRASPTTPTRAQKWLNLAVLLVLLLAVVLKASVDFPPAANLEAFRQSMPVDAVAFIKEESMPGRLFNSYNWGGYLLWELPQYPVFIDGRTDLYSDEVIDQWLQVVRAEPGWQATLDRWGVRLILLEPSMPIVAHLGNAGWQELYRDQRAVVYAR